MKIRLADFVADYLVGCGIKDVFTVTGGGAMFLNDAFGKHNKLKCIYNHHEQASSMAAEGYYKATGKLPLVCVTTGPGGINALNGVMGAYVDSNPMLVISGQVKYTTTVKSTGLPLRQLGDQEWDIVSTVKSMTKYAVMVTEPNDIKYHLEKALFLALEGRMGPVWLDIPINIQSATIDTEQLKSFDKTELTIKPKHVSSKVIDDVIDKIKEAKKPLLFAGSGVRFSSSEKIFRQLVDKSGIPFVTAWNSNDLIESNHKLHVGRPGSVGERAGNFAVQNCDLLIVLGSRLNIRTITYNYENFAKKAFKIIVDIDELELKKPTVKPDLAVCGDVKDFITKLNAKITPVKCEKWIDYCTGLKNMFDVVDKNYYENTQSVNPYCFARKLFEKLNDKACVVTANSTAAVTTMQAAEIKKGQRLFSNSGSASMGYGLPAAIGAAVGLKSQVICLEGDGSLQMNIQELMTVSSNKLPVKIFVYNNLGYHAIRQTQKSFFGEPLVGVGVDSGDLAFPELKHIAKAYNLKYYKISTHNDFSIIDSVLKGSKPCLCELMVDPQVFFAPKLSSKRLDDGTIVSPSMEDMFPFLDPETVLKLNSI